MWPIEKQILVGNLDHDVGHLIRFFNLRQLKYTQAFFSCKVIEINLRCLGDKNDLESCAIIGILVIRIE